MAISEVYVDPSIAGNSGTGTIGDPYGDLQYALNTEARDATNGDRFNVKAGTAEVLTATLSWTTYGTPTAAAPCYIQGYTSAAGDGGIGEISGNATYKIATLLNYTVLKDMKIGNVGNNDIVTGGSGHHVNVEYHTATKTSGIAVGPTDANYSRCSFHDIEATMLGGTRARAFGCTFYEGSASCVAAYDANNWGAFIGNVVSVKSTGTGITNTGSSNLIIANNIIYGAASNGSGIQLDGTHVLIVNNILEGFSASGGEGLLISGTSRSGRVAGYNGFYNCATNINGTGYDDLGSDSSYSASPFVDAANGDFRLKPGIRGGAFPTTFKGLTPTNYMDLGAMQAIQSMRRSRAVMIG